MEWTPNQVVAFNLRRIRLESGLTQEEAVERAGPFLPGKPWSRVVWSAAERSVAGKRIRQFDADELVALAAAFGVPVAAFFLPPDPDGVTDLIVRSANATNELTARELLEKAAGFDFGTEKRLRQLIEALALQEDVDWYARSTGLVSELQRRRDILEVLSEIAEILVGGGDLTDVRESFRYSWTGPFAGEDTK